MLAIFYIAITFLSGHTESWIRDESPVSTTTSHAQTRRQVEADNGAAGGDGIDHEGAPAARTTPATMANPRPESGVERAAADR